MSIHVSMKTKAAFNLIASATQAAGFADGITKANHKSGDRSNAQQTRGLAIDALTGAERDLIEAARCLAALRKSMEAGEFFPCLSND